jgi:hypothetical protein
MTMTYHKERRADHTASWPCEQNSAFNRHSNSGAEARPVFEGIGQKGQEVGSCRIAFRSAAPRLEPY